MYPQEEIIVDGEYRKKRKKGEKSVWLPAVTLKPKIRITTGLTKR